MPDDALASDSQLLLAGPPLLGTAARIVQVPPPPVTQVRRQAWRRPGREGMSRQEPSSTVEVSR